MIHLNLLRSVSLASTPLYICWGEGGGTWFQLCLDVCVQKRRTLDLFLLQVNETIDISIKMGVRFAASLTMGENLC